MAAEPIDALDIALHVAAALLGVTDLLARARRETLR